mgnify:CR=1 FL=1
MVRFAIVTEITKTSDGRLRRYERVPLTSEDLRAALRASVSALGWLTLRSHALRAVELALDEQERKLRDATRGLGPEHS